MGRVAPANVVYERERVGDHEVSWHREEYPGVATNFNRFPVEPPHLGYTPFNYNRVGEGVVKTATFMASGVHSYTMRAVSEWDPEATGAGLVRCGGGMRPPRMLGVAAAMHIPEDLAVFVLNALAHQDAERFCRSAGLSGSARIRIAAR